MTQKKNNPPSIKNETLEKQTVPLSKKPLQRFQENSLYQQVKPQQESISSKTANPAQP